MAFSLLHQRLIDSSESHHSLDRGVPVVFNGVVCPPGEKLGNDGPLIAMDFVGGQEGVVFLFGPFVLVDLRVQVVVPPFTTLLSDSILKLPGNDGPVFGPIFLNELQEQLVLCLGPASFEAEPFFALLSAPSTAFFRDTFLFGEAVKLVGRHQILARMGLEVTVFLVRTRCERCLVFESAEN